MIKTDKLKKEIKNHFKKKKFFFAFNKHFFNKK